ncbi:hypothetical protein BSTP3_036 [Bacillus phage BSTP3]|nr:hypothetical protein BSTP3_036 [Bacillus phage BSTP3]
MQMLLKKQRQSIMAKDWVYIGSTPPHLTREANEAELKKYAFRAQKLREDLARIKSKLEEEKKDSQ